MVRNWIPLPQNISKVSLPLPPILEPSVRGNILHRARTHSRSWVRWATVTLLAARWVSVGALSWNQWIQLVLQILVIFHKADKLNKFKILMAGSILPGRTTLLSLSKYWWKDSSKFSRGLRLLSTICFTTTVAPNSKPIVWWTGCLRCESRRRLPPSGHWLIQIQIISSNMVPHTKTTKACLTPLPQSRCSSSPHHRNNKEQAQQAITFSNNNSLCLSNSCFSSSSSRSLSLHSPKREKRTLILHHPLMP